MPRVEKLKANSRIGLNIAIPLTNKNEVASETSLRYIVRSSSILFLVKVKISRIMISPFIKKRESISVFGSLKSNAEPKVAIYIMSKPRPKYLK